jgi:hypothetical protein
MSDPALTKEEATNIASYIASEDFSKDEPLAFELIVSALDNHCSVVPNLSIVLDAVLPVLRIQSNEEYIRAESLKVAMIASSPSRFSRPTLLKLGAINKHTPKSESLSEHRGY